MSVNKVQSHTLDIDVRFLLANERTLLAWIRTGLTFIAGGVAVTLLSSNENTLTHISGVGAILVGATFAIVGYTRFKLADSAIRSGNLPKSGPSTLAVVVCVILFASVVVLSSVLT